MKQNPNLNELFVKVDRNLHSTNWDFKWQYFEKLVAWIFEQNDFEVRHNIIVKTSAGKRQFDVVAEKYGRIFLVECKKWRSKGERTAALRSTVRKHLERCGLYSMKLMEESALNRTPDSIEVGAEAWVPDSACPKKKIVPVIVTLLEEDITEHDNVSIIPILKLDWFLNNVEGI